MSIPEKQIPCGWLDRESVTYCSFRQMFFSVYLEFVNLRLRFRYRLLHLRIAFSQFRIFRLERRLARLVRETGRNSLSS